MTIDLLKQKSETLNFKNISNKKKKSWLKMVIGVPLIAVLSLGSLMTINAYHNSKQIDNAQKYYETMQSYNDFKQKMDSVPYTDVMFKNDLSAFKLIYSHSDKRPDVAKSFLPFIDNKVYFDNNFPQVEKSLSYTEGFKNYNDFFMSSKFQEQKDYKYKNMNEKDKAINTLTEFKMFSINYNFQPDYIRKNLQRYVKDNNLPIFSFGLTKEQNDYIKENRFDNKKMEAMQKENDDAFVNYINHASESDLRKLFKMYNSYYMLVASQHLVDETYTKYSILPMYLGKIDDQVFYKVEELRDVFTGNGKINQTSENENQIDQNRAGSIW